MMYTRLNKVVFVFSVIILLSGAAMFLHPYRQSQARQHSQREAFIHRKIIVDIGPYPNLEAEQKASINRLSLELSQHPLAKAVRINAGPSAWRHGVIGYIRNGPLKETNLFWYDDRFSNPEIGIVINGKDRGIHVEELVSEDPIHVVAHKNGVPDDVFSYDNHLRKQTGHLAF